MNFEVSYEQGFALASYMPRGFYIRLNIDTGDRPDELSFTPPTLRILLHEYGHLIQDRATIFGVQSLLQFYDSFWSIRQHAEAIKKGEPIRIPLRDQVVNGFLPGTAKPCMMHQIEAIRSALDAHHAWPPTKQSWAFDSHRVESFNYRVNDKDISLPLITVVLVDNVKNEKYEHSLGAWEIDEAYSSAIEIIHGEVPFTAEECGFEYLAVERILIKYFGNIDARQIVSICHWALQDDAPAACLFSLIEALDLEFGHALPEADDLYDWLREESLERGYRDKCDTLCNLLDTIASEHQRMNAEGQLSAFFLWYAGETRRHLDRNIDTSRRFPLDTLLCNNHLAWQPEDRDRELRALFTDLPIPMLEIIDGQAWAFGGHSSFDGSAFFIRSMKQLVDTVWSGSRSEWQCPFYMSCDLEIRNDECRVAPWKKGNLEAPCGYGAAAKILMLDDRQFIV